MSKSFAQYGPIGHREEAFLPSEYQGRLERVRTYLQQEGLDVLITFSPTNITYLCGHSSLNIHDFQCLIVPQTEAPVMILWFFELGRFHVTATAARPEAYDTGDDPIKFTVEMLRKYGWLEHSLGIDGGVAYSASPVVIQRLIDALPPRRVKLVAGIIERVRAVKSPAEIEQLRKAAYFTAAGTEAAIGAVRALSLIHI